MAAVDRVEGGCGVVEAVLKDGREFSILSAPPAWWRAELEKRGLDFYFGPMVLFVDKLDAAHAKKASKLMAETDEQLFCRYDTPAQDPACGARRVLRPSRKVQEKLTRPR